MENINKISVNKRYLNYFFIGVVVPMVWGFLSAIIAVSSGPAGFAFVMFAGLAIPVGLVGAGAILPLWLYARNEAGYHDSLAVPALAPLPEGMFVSDISTTEDAKNYPTYISASALQQKISKSKFKTTILSIIVTGMGFLLVWVGRGLYSADRPVGLSEDYVIIIEIIVVSIGIFISSFLFTSLIQCIRWLSKLNNPQKLFPERSLAEPNSTIT